MKRTVWFVLIVVLAACSASPASTPALIEPGNAPPTSTAVAAGSGSTMPMMGRGGGMHQRHSAPIPKEYAGLTSSVAANAESLARGAAIFSQYCATCHGDGGMGDGPTGTGLNPLPAPIAHTSQMMGDDYLFWRISEGGAVFNTSMLPWKGTLDEQARWNVINYVRALGSGKVKPATTAGGAPYDPAVELAQRKEMLTHAVDSGVITSAEADIFNTIHAVLDQQRTPMAEVSGATPSDRQAALLSALVADGSLTQTQADAFTDIHDRLAAAGLMD
jgi:mono/diheme cytochrome c family protein